MDIISQGHNIIQIYHEDLSHFETSIIEAGGNFFLRREDGAEIFFSFRENDLILVKDSPVPD